MARKNKKSGTQVMPPQVGGYVPASYQGTHNPRQGARIHDAKGQADFAGSQGGGAFNPYSRDVVDYSSRKRGKSVGKKVAIAVIVIALVAAVAGLGVYAYAEMQKNTINDNLHSMSDEEMEAVDNELTGVNTIDEPFAMLLLGSDARTDDPSMGARTDTIIVVRVDPVTNVVSMVSIPRDTKIDIPGVGTAKFNAAYTYGGPSGTIAAVKELCGIEIDHYAEINFEGLVQLIDAIGGIDVHVDETIDDIDAGNIVIPAGDQHLDGEAALVFSRSRAYADGDYTRQSNQRKVIEAIINKGLSAPANELYGLVRASTTFLTTDSGIDVDFIYSLADQMRHNSDHPLKMYASTIPSTTATIGGISYVIADRAGVAELMRVLMSGGDITAPVSASSIGADVASAGGSATTSTSTTQQSEPAYAQQDSEVAYTPTVDYEDSYSYVEPPSAEPDYPYYDGGGSDTGGTGGGDSGGAGSGDAGGGSTAEGSVGGGEA